jgi:hypothetical protein
MAAQADYLFLGSNIGPDGVLRDTQNIPEMMFLMTKKFLGIPTTIPDLIYTQETRPNLRNGIPNAFQYIHQTKIYSQAVPLSNPIGRLNGTFISGNAIIDINYSNQSIPLLFGKTINYDENSSKYISKSIPYITYYSNLLLTNVTNTRTRKPLSLYVNNETTYGHPFLQNTISPYYDFTYSYILTHSNTGSVIENFDGYSILDVDTGLLTFYDSNTSGSQVNSNNPPRISFFRYEGLFGEANILSGQDF